MSEELSSNKYMRKALKQIAHGKGKVGRFMIKVREGRATDKEIKEFLKKEVEKLKK